MKTFYSSLSPSQATPCPQSGAGVHYWTLSEANRCRLNRMSEADAVASITQRMTRAPNPANEVVQSVRKAYSSDYTCDAHYTHAPKEKAWPDKNDRLTTEIFSSKIGVAEHWEMSPVRPTREANETETIIDRLFPGNPLLCVGQSNNIFQTSPREDLRGKLGAMQFIVPSPMSKPLGVVKDGNGRQSAHTLDNTGPRRFLVIEFDQGSFDEHAARIHHLGGLLPLALTVHSGGKSLHGWFYVQGLAETEQKKFMRYSVAIGADRATWTRSQFVRMPDGLRDKDGRKVKQRVMYFNPEAGR